jgi:hypothetical protein
MGTATCRTARAVLAGALLGACGCGGSSRSPGAAGGSAAAPRSSTEASRAPRFPSLSAAAAPVGWTSTRIATGAVLFYPPGWQRERGDRGTASAVLLGADHAIIGYLNLTPRQSSETLANWPRFRIEHNRREGERAVTREAFARNVHFRRARGSCVRDSYTTVSGARFIELACIVRGAATESVIVGATPSSQWARVSPVLERAISALHT